MTIDWSFLTRKKIYNSVNEQETKLSRVLKLSDIVALGNTDNTINPILLKRIIIIYY